MKVSQREVRRMRKRILELENILARQRQAWVKSWPSSMWIGAQVVPEITVARIEVARKLGHAVVVTATGTTVEFYAAEISSKELSQ